MTDWKYSLRITHLFTEKEDKESIKKSMNDVADIIEKMPYLIDFDRQFDFREVEDIDEANELIDELYDYCDSNKIWVVPKGLDI